MYRSVSWTPELITLQNLPHIRIEWHVVMRCHMAYGHPRKRLMWHNNCGIFVCLCLCVCACIWLRLNSSFCAFLCGMYSREFHMWNTFRHGKCMRNEFCDHTNCRTLMMLRKVIDNQMTREFFTARKSFSCARSAWQLLPIRAWVHLFRNLLHLGLYIVQERGYTRRNRWKCRVAQLMYAAIAAL